MFHECVSQGPANNSLLLFSSDFRSDGYYLRVVLCLVSSVNKANILNLWVSTFILPALKRKQGSRKFQPAAWNPIGRAQNADLRQSGLRPPQSMVAPSWFLSKSWSPPKSTSSSSSKSCKIFSAPTKYLLTHWMNECWLTLWWANSCKIM